MITWHAHTKIPTTPETAIVAITLIDDESGQPESLLLPELYRFDVRMGVWVSEVGGLMLRHKEFRWASESGILATIV